MIPIEYYLWLSAVLFSIGVLGVLYRRNAIIIFMCIELMLNAVNLVMVAFSKAPKYPCTLGCPTRWLGQRLSRHWLSQTTWTMRQARYLYFLLWLSQRRR